jgi:hypothetical protein
LKLLKLISTARLFQLSGEREADTSVADPTDLGHNHAPFDQLQRQALADVWDMREEDHGAGWGDIEELDNVLSASKLEHRRARQRRMACLAPLVDAALLAPRDNCPV